MQGGIIVLYGHPDELTIYLVKIESFRKIKEILESHHLINDKIIDQVMNELTDKNDSMKDSECVISRIFTQTFCFEELNWPEIQITGMITIDNC